MIIKELFNTKLLRNMLHNGRFLPLYNSNIKVDETVTFFQIIMSNIFYLYLMTISKKKFEMTLGDIYILRIPQYMVTYYPIISNSPNLAYGQKY